MIVQVARRSAPPAGGVPHGADPPPLELGGWPETTRDHPGWMPPAPPPRSASGCSTGVHPRRRSRMTSPGLAERSCSCGLRTDQPRGRPLRWLHGVAVVASDDSSPDSASTLTDDLGIEVVLGPSGRPARRPGRRSGRGCPLGLPETHLLFAAAAARRPAGARSPSSTWPAPGTTGPSSPSPAPTASDHGHHPGDRHVRTLRGARRSGTWRPCWSRRRPRRHRRVRRREASSFRLAHSRRFCPERGRG